MQKLQNKYFKNKLDLFPTCVNQANFTDSSFIRTNCSVFMNNKYIFTDNQNEITYLLPF